MKRFRFITTFRYHGHTGYLIIIEPERKPDNSGHVACGRDLMLQYLKGVDDPQVYSLSTEFGTIWDNPTCAGMSIEPIPDNRIKVRFTGMPSAISMTIPEIMGYMTGAEIQEVE